MIEETIQLEGPTYNCSVHSRNCRGHNGILIPPDGYLQGVRKLCDKYGILMIADEVMAGFGRTGEWFAIDHWKVVPDLICMAKGLTASVSASRCRGYASPHRPALSGQGLLRGAYLQFASHGMCRRARHHSRVRRGSPDRQRKKNGRDNEAAWLRDAGEASHRSER